MSKCAKCGEPIKYTVVCIRCMGDKKYHGGCADKVQRILKEPF